jgi:hypothetical protein
MKLEREFRCDSHIKWLQLLQRVFGFITVTKEMSRLDHLNLISHDTSYRHRAGPNTLSSDRHNTTLSGVAQSHSAPKPVPIKLQIFLQSLRSPVQFCSQDEKGANFRKMQMHSEVSRIPFEIKLACIGNGFCLQMQRSIVNIPNSLRLENIQNIYGKHSAKVCPKRSG